MDLNRQERLRICLWWAKEKRQEKLQILVQEGGKIGYRESQMRCSLRKCQPGARGFLKPRAPVEGAHVLQGWACRRPPAMLSIRWEQPVWLSWVQGQPPER